MIYEPYPINEVFLVSTLSSLPSDIQKRVQAWLSGPYDQKTKDDIQAMIGSDPQGVIDAFYRDLDFGTGGMRGLMGPGTNRLNIYTIRRATQGLANYIRKEGHDYPQAQVVIGFDSRHHSKEFAEEAARVLAGNGIPVLLIKDLRPTPFVSFACRYKKCQAGIVITASHNPAVYNGYKVYWSDGAQVVPPHDKGIIHEVEAIQDLTAIQLAPQGSPLITLVDGEIDDAYITAIRPLQMRPEADKKDGKQLSIAYTSLHGTGITLAPKALNDWGFPTIHYVEKQIVPDGDFPTVKFPNPEFKETLQLGIDLLVKEKADILLANDPDADRLGMAVLHRGQPVILTGNQIASICVEYLCHHLHELGKLTPTCAFITTIVSTEMIGCIAKAWQAACFEVLTGFKYIGEMIHLWEMTNNPYTFIFGAEESYGYLLGSNVARDKDAIVSSCLFAEIALYAKSQGKTFVDLLEEIYKKYGVFREEQKSLSFPPSKEGFDAMQHLMTSLRKNPPQNFCGKQVVVLEDYLESKRHLLQEKKSESLILPKSDVLLFRLADFSRLVIRPSGTEPKVKIYGSVREEKIDDLPSTITACDERLRTLLEDAAKELQK